MREAVFGNVGTIITFRVGSPDATFMEKEFAPRFLPEDILNLPKYNLYIKLLIDGVTSQPFSAITLPPIAQITNTKDTVVKVSRERYSSTRANIEDKILKWSGMEDVTPEQMMAEAEEKKKSMKFGGGGSRKPMFDYTCTRCGKDLRLPVELDRSRPIYCEECIELVRAERKAGKGQHDARPHPPVAALQRPSQGETIEKRIQKAPVSLSALSPSVSPSPIASRPEISLSEARPAALSVSPPRPTSMVGAVSAEGERRKRKRKRKHKPLNSPISQQQEAARSPAPPAQPTQPSGTLHSGQSVHFE